MIYNILSIITGLIGAICVSAGLYFLPYATFGRKYLPFLLMFIGLFLVFVAVGHFTRGS